MVLKLFDIVAQDGATFCTTWNIPSRGHSRRCDNSAIPLLGTTAPPKMRRALTLGA